jgi:hypothetical protein
VFTTVPLLPVVLEDDLAVAVVETVGLENTAHSVSHWPEVNNLKPTNAIPPHKTASCLPFISDTSPLQVGRGLTLLDTLESVEHLRLSALDPNHQQQESDDDQ